MRREYHISIIAITSAERLTLILRYLATGNSRVNKNKEGKNVLKYSAFV